MTRRSFPAVILICAAALLASACGSGQEGGTGRLIPAGDSADGLAVTFGSVPDPLEQGDNTIQVAVTRADGSPVTDATVTAVFSMPAMPSMNMPAMRTDATLQHAGDGRYEGTGQLSMGGTWNVAITVAQGSTELATRRTSVVVKQ